MITDTDHFHRRYEEVFKQEQTKMTRKEAEKIMLKLESNTMNFDNFSVDYFLDGLKALGLIKFDEPELIEKFCDCSCANTCPQGKIGSQMRCKIWVKS